MKPTTATTLERSAYRALAEGRMADAAGLALAAARAHALGYRDDKAGSLLRLAHELNGDGRRDETPAAA